MSSNLKDVFAGGSCAAFPNVELYDETEGILGELTDPHHVVQGILHDADYDVNVGSPEVPLEPLVSLRSASYDAVQMNSGGGGGGDAEISFEIDNMSSCYLRVRWIDHAGHCPTSTHVWTVGPSSIFQQFTHAGHLFLITVMETADGEEEDLFDSHLISSANNTTTSNGQGQTGGGITRQKESILGTYRPKRTLPSRSPHNILVEGSAAAGLIMEVLLLDDTKEDALVVASALLDDMHKVRSRKDCLHTIQVLQSILSNIQQHPTDTKYRKLRLSNKKMHRCITSVWPAMDFLKAAGFRRTREPLELPPIVEPSGEADGNEGGEATIGEQKEEEYLNLASGGPHEENTIEILKRATLLIDLLSSRLQDNFVADIAPPTPWHQPVQTSGGGVSSASSRWGRRALHFIDDEERWNRAERNRQRRGGSGRRPNPGQAPSSRGTWGR
jgi:hypothetical protein